MDARKDLALELATVLVCGLAASALFLVFGTWGAGVTFVATAAIVLVAGVLAWGSQRPYAVLAVGILCAAGVAVSQGYVMERMFVELCIFDPCAAPETRLASLVDALPLSVLPILLGALVVAAVARRNLSLRPLPDV